MISLTVSIVSYDPEPEILQRTLDSLALSLEYAVGLGELCGVDLFLIDNGPGTSWLESLTAMVHQFERQHSFVTCHLLTGHGNIGFGSGHNLAIAQAKSDFYLVLNPDVFFDEKTISKALTVLAHQKDVGLLAPFAVGEDGGNQYLCKRYPSVFDLVLRAFAPARVQQIFQSRLDRYKMKDLYEEQAEIKDITIASGCFMFFRTAVLKELTGFSERFFLYFEDFDLSLRCGKVARVVYAPDVRITHLGGHAARKSLAHIRMFSRSAFVFFKTHGLRLW